MCFSMRAQSDSKCEELLKKQITIDDFNENVEEFLLNFKTLIMKFLWARWVICR